MASFGPELARKCPFLCRWSCCLFFLCMAGMTSWWVPLSYLCWATSTLNVGSCYVANTFTALSFTMSIRLLLPCLPALEAVHLLTAITATASSYTYCQLQPMSNMIMNSMAMKVTMMSKRILLCLLFQAASLWSLPSQEATILKHGASQPATCLTTNFWSCSLVVVNMHYSPMALAYQWCKKMEICWRA